MKSLVALLLVAPSTAFVILRSSSCLRSSSHQQPLAIGRDEYLQPHFEGPVYTLDFDRMVACAEDSEVCTIEEMNRMVEGALCAYVIARRSLCKV